MNFVDEMKQDFGREMRCFSPWKGKGPWVLFWYLLKYGRTTFPDLLHALDVTSDELKGYIKELMSCGIISQKVNAEDFLNNKGVTFCEVEWLGENYIEALYTAVYGWIPTPSRFDPLI